MLTETHSLLATMVSEETISRFIAVEALLETINYDDHITAIEALGELNDLVASDLVNAMTGIYTEVLIRILGEYGIVVNDASILTMDDLLMLLKALEDLRIVDNADLVADIERGDDAVVMLAEIARVMDAVKPDKILTSVNWVDTALMNLILPVEEDREAYNKEQADAITRYNKFFNIDKVGVVHNYLKKRRYLPLNFRAIYPILHPTISVTFGLSAIAYEIVSLLMISDTPLNKMSETAVELTEEYYPAEVFVKLIVLINNELKEYSNVN